MASKKQIQANRRNARKSTGPKTPKGKALAKRNSLKHGLCAKEVVIDDGEGAEDRQEFDAMLADLVDQFQPVGSLEEMMVEKIATSYWRLRRANRYEVGVIRESLDTATDNYYEKTDHHDERYHKTDAEIDEQIKENTDQIKACQGNLKQLKKSAKNGDDLSTIDDWEHNCEWLMDKYHHLLIDEDYRWQALREKLNSIGFSDAQIWQMLIDLCEEHIHEASEEIDQLKKDKISNKLRLQRINKMGSLPDKFEMDKLLRYETAIERQMYQAIKQLEREQRRRLGDHVPPPVQVDIETHGSGDLKIV